MDIRKQGHQLMNAQSPEIAKRIHQYLFQDVLNELNSTTQGVKQLYDNLQEILLIIDYHSADPDLNSSHFAKGFYDDYQYYYSFTPITKPPFTFYKPGTSDFKVNINCANCYSYSNKQFYDKYAFYKNDRDNMTIIVAVESFCYDKIIDKFSIIYRALTVANVSKDSVTHPQNVLWYYCVCNMTGIRTTQVMALKAMHYPQPVQTLLHSPLLSAWKGPNKSNSKKRKQEFIL